MAFKIFCSLPETKKENIAARGGLHSIKERQTIKRIGRGWVDDSTGQSLILQARRPEFGNTGHGGSTCNPTFGGGMQRRGGRES